MIQNIQNQEYLIFVGRIDFKCENVYKTIECFDTRLKVLMAMY